ncbi:UDP-glucose pyrophosphorylase [Melghiribacillus thermohalophilus]|uniref:UTP--glucose-1-phosphate uridylyltransferase n=2 Tax=Melghiribacillus thermohalophilus TaxID=1324956 RepID=A0A4R3MY03_9BACI|nr:UDP-glucose pyrophosphorylase [Melghiribacillus thermohalophilus]
MMQVKKAIIPAAGLGTRFLPATKAQPKEMLPIVDKPTIQYIVEEAVASGIEDILIVSGRGKRAIEDHFDKSYELEETLAKRNKFDRLKEVQEIAELANIHYIRQKEPKGLGHAIWCARKFIGDEPFAVILGDDIVRTEGVPPCIKQLMTIFEQYQTSVIGVQTVPEEQLPKYGVIKPSDEQPEDGVLSIETLVEKPDQGQAPSSYAIMGRYILTPVIFQILEELPPGAGGEIQLTDAIQILNQNEKVLAYEFKGDRYDVGDQFGFIQATLDFALKRPDLKEKLERYIHQTISSFGKTE